ncbi:MAG: alpha/beta hydrolase family protein [Solirubrobacteraceae bacterium]
MLPDEREVRDGLSYSLWLPSAGAPPSGGVVVLHGAGSCKENHHDFARSCVAVGLGALVFDQRGHGESAGPMDGRVVQDVASMADLLRDRLAGGRGPGTEPDQTSVALRGSSMGGYLAIVAAPAAQAKAVVAICPASAQGLARALASGGLGFEADRDALTEFLGRNDLHAAVAALSVPLLLLHAEGDEQVPVEHSRELAQRMPDPRSRLVTVPHGHHRSVQHDPELTALTLRFLSRTLTSAGR